MLPVPSCCYMSQGSTTGHCTYTSKTLLLVTSELSDRSLVVTGRWVCAVVALIKSCASRGRTRCRRRSCAAGALT